MDWLSWIECIGLMIIVITVGMVGCLIVVFIPILLVMLTCKLKDRFDIQTWKIDIYLHCPFTNQLTLSIKVLLECLGFDHINHENAKQLKNKKWIGSQQ